MPDLPEGKGVYLWELQPGDTTTFYALVDGVHTGNVTVRVRRTVTVTIGIRQAHGVSTFTGTIARGEPGIQLTVARLDAVTKRVTGVASAVTNAVGNYTVRTNLPIGQAGYYALTAPTSSLDADRSRLYGLIVPRPVQTFTAPIQRQPIVRPRQPIADPVSAFSSNCTAARRAGAAPVFRGEPGYGRHLDRDNDGIGCE